MSETQSVQPSFEAMRQAMVSNQLRTNAVSDPRVVSAMLRVPRERFVPEDVRRLAYRDTAVPIGHDRCANLPIATGRLLTEAQIAPTDKVLLIGAAGGYTAAVIGRLAVSVVALESDAELVKFARGALKDKDYANVELAKGPLEKGWPKGAPYDVVVIDGAVEHVPEALIEQVRPGGRIVTGIADRGLTRLAVGARSEGGFGLNDFADVDCVRLPGFARAKAFTF